MSYYTPEKSVTISAKRMLIQGPPNSGKTQSFLSWPKPAHAQVYPGEKGDATLPRGVEGLTLHLWRDDPVEKTASAMVVQQVEALTWEILGGKYGECRSFLGDGIHKYYLHVLDWISGGAVFKGEEIGGGGDQWASARIYNRAREHFRYYIQRVMASPVEYVVFTCWDGREADDPGVKGSPMHILPDLPGKSAKEIMGEFSVVVYSQIDWAARQPGKLAPATWMLMPEGKVWGANVKVPAEMIVKMPVRVPQSLPALEKALEDAWKASQSK